MEDKIREEFEALYEESKNLIIGPMPDIEDMWIAYQSGYRSAQEEIDRIRSLLKEVNTWTDLKADPECNCIYHKIQREVESWGPVSFTNPESKV